MTPDKLPGLITKINEYFNKVEVKLTEKVPVVGHSLNTLKLGASTLAQMVATAVGYSSVHIANKNNPHNVTAEQAGSYGTADFNALIAQQINTGIVPISRYGTLSYLPAGVQGSFEGSTLVKSTGDNSTGLRETFNMQVEDNGTLVYLRNGTDGSSFGVFYSYVLNAVQAFNSSRINNTGRRYRPAFVPANRSVAYLYAGGQGVLAGRLQDDTGAAKETFFAITNNTLEDSVHSEVFLDGPAWENRLNRSEVILGKTAVYILYNIGAYSDVGYAAPLDFEMYSIPLTEFGQGKTVDPTRMTIGEVTGFMGAKYNTGDIRLAAVAEAKDTATPALVQHVDGLANGYHSGLRLMGGSGRCMTLSVLNADGTKMRSMCYHDGRYSTTGGGLQTVKFSYSWVLDLVTMKVTLDEGLTPMVITKDPTQPRLEYTGTVQNPNNGIALENTTGGDLSYRIYITDTGLQFTSRISYAPTSQESLGCMRWNTFTSIWDHLKAPMADRIPETRLGLTSPLLYGSPIGDSLDSMRLLPGNQVVVMCRNTDLNEVLIKTRLRPAGEKLEYNYQYKSVDFPNGLTGFKPSTERVALTAANRTTLIGYVQEMDDVGLKYAHGAVLMNLDTYNVRPTAIDGDLVPTGSVSATINQLNVLRDAVIAEHGNIPGETVVGGSFIELIIPRNTAVKPYAQVTFVSSNGSRMMVMVFVDVSARSGVIATLTMGAFIGRTNLGMVPGGTGAGFNTSNGIRGGAHTIYETADSFLIVGNSVAYISYPGGSILSRYRYLVNKSDGSVQNFVGNTASVNIVGERWVGLPGLGVGGVSFKDYTTKLGFNRAANTKAEYLAWNTGIPADTKVLVSQEVPQGWVIYFTEDTPVIINGVPGMLRSTSIDLVTVKANPANSTFYVYVELKSGLPVYVIYDRYVAETVTTLLVGTVVTGDLSISTIRVDKVTKFAGFRLSTSPLGSSIPASAGFPSREGHLDAGWHN